MKASQSQQESVANKLATKYNKPVYASGEIGFPEIAYACAQQPTMTLDHFFSMAESD